ncbi:MAG TPA: carboxypeptidase regulatory-like domain-containing protein [Bryobacteraceae bacterium]|nr:carboxypeptidase regulatory-like domain-containing protein [Bryobacteraceae bacterium]
MNQLHARLLLAALCAQSLLVAQGTGSIYGTILDPSGSVVSDASVTITNEATGVRRTLQTAGDGQYLLSPLPVGSYRIEVEAKGFGRKAQTGIDVRADERARVDVEIAIGQTSQLVEVKAQQALVESSTATLSTLIDRERVSQLPLNGRNVLDLQRLLPGVTGNTGESGGSNPGLSVNGTRGTMSNYTMDGANAVDGFTNTAHSMPNPDAVQEFSMVTFAMSAEYGRGAGGQINVVTKSGTNDFHGTAFEFLRNNALNARSFFAASKETLRQNQFGGTFGGPVLIPKLYNGKDRTFFFFSHQSTIQRFHSLNTVNYLMSDLERQGNFSRSARIPNDPATNAPFPGGIIPASRIDPISRKVVDELLPNANGGAGGIYRFTFPRRLDQVEYLGRIDHIISDKNRLSGRFFWNDRDERLIGGLPQFLNWVTAPTRNFVLEDTHVFSPNKTNVARYVETLVQERGGQLLGTSFDQLGVKIFVPEVAGQKWLVLSTPDFALSGRRPSDERRRLTQITDTFMWIKGKHQIKLGGELRRIFYDIPLGSVAGGSFTFGTNFTGVSSGDLLLGLPTRFFQDAPRLQTASGFEQDFFFQDDIRVSRRFTLNLGVRYEPRVPVRERNGNFTSYIPGAKSTRFPNAPLGLVFPGDAGVPVGGYFADLNNVAPRVGFAWDVFGNGRTSLRGGYGVFYDNIRWGGTETQGSSEPFVRSVDINAPGSFSDPYGTSGTRNPFPFDPASVNKDYVFSPRINAWTWDPNFRIGYLQHWALTAERELPGSSMLRVAYVGNKGTKLWSSRDLNYAPYVPGASTLANINDRRPIPGFASLDRSESQGFSTYNALQTTFNKRYSRGVTVLLSYSWQQTLDSISRGRQALSQPWPNNLALNKGRANFAVDHVLVTSFVWDLPFLRTQQGFAGRVFGGWQLSGILTMRTGLPFDVVPGQPSSLSGTGGERANLVGDPFLPSGRSRQDQLSAFFNKAAFAVPPDGSWGNFGRNVMSGPGQRNLDLVFGKSFRIAERHTISFRSEWFNSTNTPTFNNPVNAVTNGNFGRITGAGAGRVIQMALKYAF